MDFEPLHRSDTWLTSSMVRAKQDDSMRSPLRVAILFWLIGTAAQRCGLHERMRRGSRKRHAYSRIVLARLLLGWENRKTIMAVLGDAIGPLDRWLASDRDALLTG
ncbi:MAG TPA: hypothetical protein DDY14_02545 [Chromatiaceae bacterium]|jgi:hypothetical protein|nr:MAG: hypothetical protein N838_06380 [Thiohalocapsa sp. PB-PSB1]QQO56231.1 MAG: hypothetical protein N838_25585 [Thiohalocapsa sp. PB-PSB1]HBG94206.1 hypothetical protein [Chromatiaceae bacterium]